MLCSFDPAHDSPIIFQFNSGLEDLHNAQNEFADDYKLWDDLPSHPLPTASETSLRDITNTRYSAVTPAGHPSSIPSHPESVRGSLDDHAMTPDPNSSQTVSGAVKASSSHAEGSEIESSSDDSHMYVSIHSQLNNSLIEIVGISGQKEHRSWQRRSQNRTQTPPP